MITLAMENAIWTGFVVTHSGTFLMSVCVNRPATLKPSITFAFRFETCPATGGKVSLLTSSRCVRSNLSHAKTRRIAAHLDPRQNPANLERLVEVPPTGRGR